MPFLINTIRRWRYPGSRAYWERRYARGGDSGPGSSGILAAYKAEIVNYIVRENNIRSVTEFGCGDGKQLRLADYPAYTGLDIASGAVAICRKRFAEDVSKRFETYKPDTFQAIDYESDMTLSMEVVFHLTENEDYERYMRHLFASARRVVVIFSSDEEDNTGGIFPHFRPRAFTPDLPRLAPEWILRERIVNPHRAISVSDFFIFERRPL